MHSNVVCVFLIKTHAQFDIPLLCVESCVAQPSDAFFVRSLGCALFVYGGINMNFSQNFKTARTAKKLTQQQLADILNMNRSSISKYENGISLPPTKRMLEICGVLGVTIDELIK